MRCAPGARSTGPTVPRTGAGVLTWGISWEMRRLLFAGLLVSLVGIADTALARRESKLRYPYSLVWTTAVRMVRVDYSSPITEKDKEEGYFLFAFVHDGKEHPGSFEVIEDDGDGARVIVQIPAMPSYVEQMLIDKLERKLSQDHGAPREKKAPEPKKPSAPAEGEDGDKPSEDDGSKAPSDGEPGDKGKAKPRDSE
jgi:hypothetical protein